MSYRKASNSEKPYVVPEVFRESEDQLDSWDYYIHSMERVQRLESKGQIPPEMVERLKGELYTLLCHPSIIEELQQSAKDAHRDAEELRKEVKSLEETVDRYQQSTPEIAGSSAVRRLSSVAKVTIVIVLIAICFKACSGRLPMGRQARCVPEIERNLAGSLMRLNIQLRRSQPCS